MHRVTARDVAAAVAVDPSTVSRVLYGKSRRHKYDPRTVRRIREAANRLGYRPSGMARALRSGKTTLIGLVVADIASPFFAELAGRIQRHLQAAGYHLAIANTDEQADRQRELIGEMTAHPMEGLIIAPSGSAGLSQACDANLPVVTIDRPGKLPGVGHVGLDDRLAGQMIGRRLREGGYRRVGVILPDSPDNPGLSLRLEGLKDGMGGDGEILWTIAGPRTTFAPDVTGALCDQVNRQTPDALVGLNLACNLTVLSVVSRLRLEVPRRIGVIGIDDFPAAAFWQPPITLAAQPVERIAREAVEMLVRRIERPTAAAAETRLLPPLMMERHSLRDPPGRTRLSIESVA